MKHTQDTLSVQFSIQYGQAKCEAIFIYLQKLEHVFLNWSHLAINAFKKKKICKGRVSTVQKQKFFGYIN